MWSDETKIKLFGINSTCRVWRGKKAEYEHHPHRQVWRRKHYAVGLFIYQEYRTTQPHRGDYGWGHAPWNILGLNLIPSFPPIENATLRIWRGSAKRSGPKSLLRCL